MLTNIRNAEPKIAYSQLREPGWHNPYSDKATGWKTQQSSFDYQQRQQVYLFSRTFRSALGPPNLIFEGYRSAQSAEIKWPEGETNHSRPSTVEVNNNWSYKFSPLYAPMSSTGISVTWLTLLTAHVEWSFNFLFRDRLLPNVNKANTHLLHATQCHGRDRFS
jgi:hypothetical protein